jgi:hypothetical protein
METRCIFSSRCKKEISQIFLSIEKKYVVDKKKWFIHYIQKFNILNIILEKVTRK